jgi:hypothetical protein
MDDQPRQRTQAFLYAFDLLELDGTDLRREPLRKRIGAGDIAATEDRVARRADIPEEAAPLIDLLVEQRLLATDRVAIREGDTEQTEITIEPAHEALLRQWGLLRGASRQPQAAIGEKAAGALPAWGCPPPRCAHRKPRSRADAVSRTQWTRTQGTQH